MADRFEEFVKLAEDMDGLGQSLLPLQAVVTARTSGGRSVWVRFVGEPAGSPSTKVPVSMDCPVGTTVWVFRTGGGKGFAVPQGIAERYTNSDVDWNIRNRTSFPVSFRFDGGENQSTTSIDPYNPSWYAAKTLWFPPGSWKLRFSYFTRTAVSGGQGQWVVFRIDGTLHQFINYGDNPWVAACNYDVTLDGGPSGRNISFEGGFCGAWAAGTATNRGLSLWGSAWKGH